MHLLKTSSPLTSTTAIVWALALTAGCSSERQEPPAGHTDIPGVALLDNGEDGNNTSIVQSGYAGFWYTFDDKCECDNSDRTAGETNPLPDPLGGPQFTMTSYAAANAPPAPLEGNQAETIGTNEYGARITGGGHNWFGAGLGVALNNAGALLPLDASMNGVTAIRFQARNATGPATLKVRITDSYSEPDGNKCIVRPEADNRCTFPDGMECGTQGCFDHAVSQVAITDQWATYTVPIADLAREGWGSYLDGVVAIDGADMTQAYQLQIAIFEDTFDLWLDNIGFVQTGGVAVPAAQ